jgi:uncharacterized Rmd1/YagE family protein
MRILCFCIAQRINILDLEASLKQKQITFSRFVDLIQVSEPGNDAKKRCFFLKNGTVILWNIGKREAFKYLDLVLPHCEGKMQQFLRDAYLYNIRDKLSIRPHQYFNAEMLTLPEDDVELILSLTYVFSLSIKLSQHENQLKTLIVQYAPIISQQSKKGKISISRARASMIIAEILEIKSVINLKSMFVYPSQFFWSHPGLEQHYLMLQQYLDIPKRHDILNNQLDIMTEVFSMLNSYLTNKHSHFLEMVVILLIATEITFNLFNLHLF